MSGFRFRDRLAAARRWLTGEDAHAAALADIARLAHVLDQCEADRLALAGERNEARADADRLRSVVERLRTAERGHLAIVERAKARAALAATGNGTLYKDLWKDTEIRLTDVQGELVRAREREKAASRRLAEIARIAGGPGE